MSGCEREIRHPKIVHGKTEQILHRSVNMRIFNGQINRIEWLSKKTESGIKWYPARVIYDKQGHMTVIPLEQKTIPGTTSKIERHCHSNSIGDTLCELTKTVYDKNGNIIKRIILQKQRAIHAPLPGSKPIEIRDQKKNKIN